VSGETLQALISYQMYLLQLCHRVVNNGQCAGCGCCSAMENQVNDVVDMDSGERDTRLITYLAIFSAM